MEKLSQFRWSSMRITVCLSLRYQRSCKTPTLQDEKLPQKKSYINHQKSNPDNTIWSHNNKNGFLKRTLAWTTANRRLMQLKNSSSYQLGPWVGKVIEESQNTLFTYHIFNIPILNIKMMILSYEGKTDHGLKWQPSALRWDEPASMMESRTPDTVNSSWKSSKSIYELILLNGILIHRQLTINFL